MVFFPKRINDYSPLLLLLQSIIIYIIVDIKPLQKLWEVLSCRYILLLYKPTQLMVKRIDAANTLSVLAWFLDENLLHLFQPSPGPTPIFCYNILLGFFSLAKLALQLWKPLEYEEANLVNQCMTEVPSLICQISKHISLYILPRWHSLHEEVICKHPWAA